MVYKISTVHMTLIRGQNKVLNSNNHMDFFLSESEN